MCHMSKMQEHFSTQIASRFVEPRVRTRASLSARPKKNPAKRGLFFGLAEREGFEPSIRY